MSNRNISVSLIITTYNWEKALKHVLQSLFVQSVLPDEVIIADDGSNQATKDLILDPYSKSKGLAYVRGDFAIPEANDPDYFPLRIGLAMLDDLLFEIVRTQNSACYSAWVYARSFKANYGSIVIYKTQVPDEVKEYIDEAISIMLKGQCLAPKISASAAGKSGIGEEKDVKETIEGKYGPIEDALEFYKAQFINSYFEGQQTNSSIAKQIYFSILYNNDYRDYLLVIDKINNVTAEDILPLNCFLIIEVCLADPALCTLLPYMEPNFLEKSDAQFGPPMIF